MAQFSTNLPAQAVFVKLPNKVKGVRHMQKASNDYTLVVKSVTQGYAGCAGNVEFCIEGTLIHDSDLRKPIPKKYKRELVSRKTDILTMHKCLKCQMNIHLTYYLQTDLFNFLEMRYGYAGSTGGSTGGKLPRPFADHSVCHSTSNWW